MQQRKTLFRTTQQRLLLFRHTKHHFEQSNVIVDDDCDLIDSSFRSAASEASSCISSEDSVSIRSFIENRSDSSDFPLVSISDRFDDFKTSWIRSPYQCGEVDEDHYRFWTCKTALFIYIVVIVAILARQPLLMNLVSIALLNKMIIVWKSWFGYIAQDEDTIRAFKCQKVFLRFLRKQSEKAIQGSYTRRVVIGYIHYCLTAPGETFMAYFCRYKMSMLNYLQIEELKLEISKKLSRD